ncbi:RNA-binding RNA processing protein [Hanseniaspora uvarum]|nr:RNA-binding RNA processing protein [Hanseniaspora uvarum]
MVKSQHMQCDLNIPFPKIVNKENLDKLELILHTLIELNYTHVAINKQLSPKMYYTPSKKQKQQMTPKDLQNLEEYDLKADLETYFKQFEILEQKFKSKQLKLFTRVTVEIDDPNQLGSIFINLNSPSAKNRFDLVAILPLSEKGLAFLTNNNGSGSNSTSIDILTFDYANYFNGFHLKHKTMNGITRRGIKVEILYSFIFNNLNQSNLKFINNSKQVIRCCRKGIKTCIISSGATQNIYLRGKIAIESILDFLGLKPDVYSRMLKENPISSLLNGRLRVKSYQQTIATGIDVMMKDPEIEKEGYEVVNGFVVKSNIEENLEDKLEPPTKKLKK